MQLDAILVDENGEETYEDFFYSTRNVCTQVYEYIGTRPRQYCTFFYMRSTLMS